MTNLSLDERKYIEAEIKKGIASRQIAEILQRSESTVRKEVRRNGGKENYDANKAHAAKGNNKRSEKVNQTRQIKESQLVDIITFLNKIYRKLEHIEKQIGLNHGKN